MASACGVVRGVRVIVHAARDKLNMVAWATALMVWGIGDLMVAGELPSANWFRCGLASVKTWRSSHTQGWAVLCCWQALVKWHCSHTWRQCPAPQHKEQLL